MKIKVNYDCNEETTELLSVEQFVSKFNSEEINSATDTLEVVEEPTVKANESYAFICYEDESVDLEEFTVFGRTYEQVQNLIQSSLADGKSFKVVVFKGSEE